MRRFSFLLISRNSFNRFPYSCDEAASFSLTNTVLLKAHILYVVREHKCVALKDKFTSFSCGSRVGLKLGKTRRRTERMPKTDFR